MNLTYLKQWCEPDGDNDQLFNVRMEVKSLIAAHEKSQGRLEWMVNQLVGMKWADTSAGFYCLKPEDEKYVSECDLLEAIDEKIAQERVSP